MAKKTSTKAAHIVQRDGHEWIVPSETSKPEAAILDIIGQEGKYLVGTNLSAGAVFCPAPPKTDARDLTPDLVLEPYTETVIPKRYYTDEDGTLNLSDGLVRLLVKFSIGLRKSDTSLVWTQAQEWPEWLRKVEGSSIQGQRWVANMQVIADLPESEVMAIFDEQWGMGFVSTDTPKGLERVRLFYEGGRPPDTPERIYTRAQGDIARCDAIEFFDSLKANRESLRKKLAEKRKECAASAKIPIRERVTARVVKIAHFDLFQ